MYRQGRPWHITDPGLLRQAEAEQQSRYDSDVWEETVAEYVSDKHEVTISEIMKTALSIEIPRMDRAGQNRVMKILPRLGWDRGDRLASGRTAWVRQEPND